MIKLNVQLVEADVIREGYSTTEDACIEMAKNFKEKQERVNVRLGKSPLIMGKLVELVYDKEKKLLMGVLELNINFGASGQVLQKLETPTGTRVLSCNIKEINLIPGGMNE